MPDFRKKTTQIRRRADNHSDKTSSKIWFEQPSRDNPYLTDKLYCHGYDLDELASNFSLSNVIYLLFRGELPSKSHAELFDALMIAFITPGPRHPAARSATIASVSKTDTELLLPLALSINSGERNGAAEVDGAMKFILKHRKDNAESVVQSFGFEAPEQQALPDPPGFGSSFGGTHQRLNDLAHRLSEYPSASDCISWGIEFSEALAKYNRGWRATGLFAAALADLGFIAKAGPSIFQVCCAPGLAAQALEHAGKPLTSVPFVEDSSYTIDTQGS